MKVIKWLLKLKPCHSQCKAPWPRSGGGQLKVKEKKRKTEVFFSTTINCFNKCDLFNQWLFVMVEILNACVEFQNFSGKSESTFGYKNPCNKTINRSRRGYTRQCEMPHILKLSENLTNYGRKEALAKPLFINVLTTKL